MANTDMRPVAPETDYVSAGIGGWLILPAIHLLLGLALMLFTAQWALGLLAPGAMGHLSRVAIAYVSAAVPDDVSETSAINATTYFLGFTVFVTLFTAVCAVSFFLKKRFVPLLMICFYVFSAAHDLGYAILLGNYPGTAQTNDPNVWLAKMQHADMALLPTLFWSGVWIVYFIRSNRVRKTFVN
jgi:hypothetical protein